MMKNLRLLFQGIRRANKYMFFFGGSCVLFFMFVTLIDVGGRYFRKPLAGAFELSELALASMVVFTWAHTQAERGHICIDLFFRHLPRRAQGIADMVISFLGFSIVAILTWQVIDFVSCSKASGEWTDLLHIPLYPFKFFIFIGGLAFCIQLVFDMVESYRRFREGYHGDIS